MIHKSVDKIEPMDIEALVEESVAENRTLEYKQEMPGKSDKSKKEFLADVTSFANASGGDILYGVTEKRQHNLPTGEPEEARGISIENRDAEKLRLENCIRDGVEPRIPGVQLEWIEGFPDGPVLLIRIPRSWISPHMVKFKNSSRFFSRNSAGKFQMDVSEIRTAFEFSATLPEKIQRFRDQRLAKLVADETPVRLSVGLKSVLHVMPLLSFSPGFQIILPKIYEKRVFQPLIELGQPGESRFNFEGYVIELGVSQGYCQYFRSGTIEMALPWSWKSNKNPSPISLFREIRKDTLKSLPRCFEALQDLSVSAPVIVQLSLSGVKELTRIQEDILILPDVLIEEYSCDVPKTLKTMFDALWNSAGFESSP